MPNRKLFFLELNSLASHPWEQILAVTIQANFPFQVVVYDHFVLVPQARLEKLEQRRVLAATVARIVLFDQYISDANQKANRIQTLLFMPWRVKFSISLVILASRSRPHCGTQMQRADQSSDRQCRIVVDNPLENHNHNENGFKSE
jgi:hypothetical protein